MAGSHEGADSDPSYAMVEGDDSYPDLLVSRISAQNPDQVETQVAKIIRYERDPDTGLAGSWFHKGTGIASDEDEGTGLYDHDRADLLRQQLLDYTFTDVSRIYQVSGATTGDITAALNDGVSLINYLGHGTGTGWINVFFSNVEVHELANGSKLPWIIDVACNNGEFSWDECFAEAWLRAGTATEPRGAIGMFAASMNASWEPPCIMQAEVIDQLCTETANILGTLCFAGTIETLNQYPPPNPEGIKLAEEYNLFGDCSLQVRTDKPASLEVQHEQFLPLRSESYAIEVFGIADAVATLCRGDTLYARGATDATGQAELSFERSLEQPGDLVLTVTAYNHRPYISTVHVVPQSSVVIDPNPINVGETTLVTVSVADSLGVGMEGIQIDISGFDGVVDCGSTGPDGTVVNELSTLYGEILRVRGRHVGQTQYLFNEPLQVAGAPPLPGAAISAAVASIALADGLAPGFTGTITAGAGVDGLTLRVLGCGIDDFAETSGSEIILPAVPDETGRVTAQLGCSGYDLFTAAIPVVEAVATISGRVTSGGSSLGRVSVRIEDGSGQVVYETYTYGTGYYDIDDEIPVTDYSIVASCYGYAPHEEPLALQYGENVFDIELAPAPSAVLHGTVTAMESGEPLEATIELLRGDNLDLCAQTVSDPGDGSYTIPSLLYYDYVAKVRSWRRAILSHDLTLAQPDVTQDFALEPPRADLLVVDDFSKGHASESKAASPLAADLEDLGFFVTFEDIDVTDPTVWDAYDLTVINSGDNATALMFDIEAQQAIIDYVESGGHILVEGGDFARHLAGIRAFDFLRKVVHVEGGTYLQSGSAQIMVPDHCVVSHPHAINGAVSISYEVFGDKDATIPCSDAVMVGSWTTYPEYGSIVAYDPNSLPEGGQSVFFSFDYAEAEPAKRRQLLENSALWLLNPETGTGSISGIARLRDQSNHADIRVMAEPGGGMATTAAGGAFVCDELRGDSWRIVASKPGWTTEFVDVELAEGEHVGDVEIILDPAMIAEVWGSTIAIPDNDPNGATGFVEVGDRGRVVGVEVYLQVFHDRICHLEVTLISPNGTEVDLLRPCQHWDGDLVGWFPAEICAVQDLNIFRDEPMHGTWALRGIDWVRRWGGSIFRWCVRIYYAPDAVGIAGSGLAAYASTGGVTLTWQYDAVAVDGCHLYRRSGPSDPIRLTTEPLSSPDGYLTFHDSGEGIAAGTELAYSYAMICEDQEIGHSLETTITFISQPRLFALHPNYPNPFNPVTSIRFELPQPGPATLRIYDLSGRLVRTLVDGRLPAAVYVQTWDGTDDRGLPVASGVYHMRLTAPGSVATRKMMLIE